MSDGIRISVDGYHSRLFNELERHAWSHPGPASVGAIIKPIFDEPIRPKTGDAEQDLLGAILSDDGGMDYQCLSEFKLPPGSPRLGLDMARFSMVSPLTCKPIPGLSIPELPETTFCLYEFLSASFPRNPRTHRMRGTIGASVPDLEDMDQALDAGVLQEFKLHCRFAGLGVVLMRSARLVIGELLTEHEVCKRADKNELLLVMFEGSA